MRSRGTLTLLLVAVALFAYIWVFERQTVPREDPGQTENLIFRGLEPTRVTALTISQTNGVVRVERVGGLWQLTDPTYPAQGLAVDNWLESVAKLQSSAHLSATDLLAQPSGVASLGLEPPRATVTIDQGPRRFQFRLGHRTPLGEKMYLQLLGSEGVEITSAQPLDQLPVKAAAWRDPQFLLFAGLRFDRFQVRSGKREYELHRSAGDSRWRLTFPQPARADLGQVQQRLQQLQTMQIVGFANESTPPDLEPYGLESPQATLTFSQGSNSVLSVEFGASPTNAPELIAALRSNLPGIVLVPRSAFELVSVPYSELLDYRLVDIPFDQVSRIEISAGERLILERPSDGAWRFAELAGVPADSGLVAMLLEKLHDLRFLEVAKEVVTELDLPTYGLAPAGRSYTLHWRVGTNMVAGNSTSAWLRVDFGTNRADRLFARRSDEIPVYEVATQAVAALPSAPFQLRERRLCDFTTNQVVSFAVTRYGETRKGLRSPGGQWGPAPGSQWIVNTFALEEALYRLGTLQARYWVARGTDILDQYGIPQLAHRLVIEIQRDGRPEILTLDFGVKSPSGGPFAAMELDGQPTIFEFPIEVFYAYDEAVRSMKFPEPSEP